jgi:hypothetical protein
VNIPRSSGTTISGLSSLKIILHHPCVPRDRPEMSLPAPLDRLKNMLHHISVSLWRDCRYKLRLSCKLKLALPSRPSQVTAGSPSIEPWIDFGLYVRTRSSIQSSAATYSTAAPSYGMRTYTPADRSTRVVAIGSEQSSIYAAGNRMQIHVAVH